MKMLKIDWKMCRKLSKNNRNEKALKSMQKSMKTWIWKNAKKEYAEKYEYSR